MEKQIRFTKYLCEFEKNKRYDSYRESTFCATRGKIQLKNPYLKKKEILSCNFLTSFPCTATVLQTIIFTERMNIIKISYYRKNEHLDSLRTY